jgi:hypothetical protein
MCKAPKYQENYIMHACETSPKKSRAVQLVRAVVMPLHRKLSQIRFCIINFMLHGHCKSMRPREFTNAECEEHVTKFHIYLTLR